MKIAIVHDELIRRGGAEQFTLILHKAFPDAPIFTSTYNPETTYEAFKNCNIKTSSFGRFVKSEKMLKLFFFPFSIWAMRRIDLSEYDVVFMSTTTSAKFVTTSSKTLLIAFCHFPFRLAWYPESYIEVRNAKGPIKYIFKRIIAILKRLDYAAVQKIDWLITNTQGVKAKIIECYQPKTEVRVIPSSIVCRNFYVSDNPLKDYYLVVSRFESYKRIDLVIDAFNKMPNRKLIIVGKGSMKEMYKKLANKNIQFKEGLSAQEIADLYANCKAFLFPQEEDFGLTPLEANASGRPVIAFGKGGVIDTMIPYNTDAQKSTALLFDEQTPEKLIDAMDLFDNLNFDSKFIRQHAEKFDEDVFVNKIKDFVTEKYISHKSK